MDFTFDVIDKGSSGTRFVIREFGIIVRGQSGASLVA